MEVLARRLGPRWQAKITISPPGGKAGAGCSKPDHRSVPACVLLSAADILRGKIIHPHPAWMHGVAPHLCAQAASHTVRRGSRGSLPRRSLTPAVLERTAHTAAYWLMGPDAVRPLSHGAMGPMCRRSRQIKPARVAQRVDAHRSRPDGYGVRVQKTRQVVHNPGYPDISR